MIFNQLETHWVMCKALRLSPNPELRTAGARYFCAKKRTPLDDPLEVKAVGFVTEFGTTLFSQMKL